MRIILLNGPARVGKDTASKMILRYRDGVRIGFADHLKRATHAAYGMFDAPFDAFEARKDQPCDEFLGLTPRAAYIAHSETYIKPLHGKEFFGAMFVRAAKEAGSGLVIVPDSGFAPEAHAVIAEFGAENITLIRLRMAGKDFTGDSRGYIELPVRSFDVENVAGDQTRLEFQLAAILQ